MMLESVVGRVYSDMSGRYGGNFGAVALEDQVVMIDSGMVHTHMTEVKNWISEEFSLPVTKLIYTHSHSDHVFGAQGLGRITRVGSLPMYNSCIENLKDSWKREVLLRGNEPRKEERPELWAALQTLEVQLPDLIFSDSVKIGIGEDLEVKLMGGHTGGSSIVVVEPEHVVFIGDLIFNETFPYIGDSSCDPDRWIEGLQKVLSNDYNHIISGHGPICSKDVLEYQIEFFENFRSSVKDAINDGLTHEEYLRKGFLPKFYEEGLDRRGPAAVEFMFTFYS